MKLNSLLIKKNKGQIAIEFLLLTTFSLFLLVTFLIVLNKMSSTNSEIQREKELYDFGDSIKKEISSASEMEKGYHRIITLPSKIKGQNYTLSIDNGINGNSYLVLTSGTLEYLYQLPEVSGNIGPGENIIKKQEYLTIENNP